MTTDEQRAKGNERSRRHRAEYAGMTPEQKTEHAAYMRQEELARRTFQ